MAFTHSRAQIFLDILKIDNMWNFATLTKLQMDNNIIEKIEGLEKLVNLEWLGNTALAKTYVCIHSLMQYCILSFLYRLVIQ